MISGDCVKIPLKTYQRRTDGKGKDPDHAHQTWSFINPDGWANDETPAFEL